LRYECRSTTARGSAADVIQPRRRARVRSWSTQACRLPDRLGLAPGTSRAHDVPESRFVTVIGHKAR